MKVICNSCGHEFESTLDELGLPDGGVRLSFSCPRCGTLYPVARMTRRGVELRTQIGQATDRDVLRELRSQLRREITDERGR